jgi:hypothetical protein
MIEGEKKAGNWAHVEKFKKTKDLKPLDVFIRNIIPSGYDYPAGGPGPIGAGPLRFARCAELRRDGVLRSSPGLGKMCSSAEGP